MVKSDEEQAESERRTTERHMACFPAHLAGKDGSQHVSLIKDLSVTGARLFTRRKPEVGSELTLGLHLRAGAEPFEARGRVVRSEARPPELSDFWRYTVGVEFLEPAPEIEADVAELAKRQASADEE